MVHLVKTMVFPIVMYGCESWTVEKAERQRIDAFELWCWRRLLRVPWTVRRSNQSILKEMNPEYLLEELMLKLKLQYFGHLMARAAAAAAPKSLQSCPTLCDPIDGSPPGSAVTGILQARTLEWVAISFSNAWKWKVKMKSLSHVRWERLKAGEGDDRRREGWIAPWTQRTWVWTGSGRWWRTGKPGVHGVTKSWTQLSDWTTDHKEDYLVAVIGLWMHIKYKKERRNIWICCKLHSQQFHFQK